MKTTTIFYATLFIIIEKEFKKQENIDPNFDTEVKVLQDLQDEYYIKYGALFFAKPIKHIEKKGKIYADNFTDFYCDPKNIQYYSLSQETKPEYKNGKVIVTLKNKQTQKTEKSILIPFSKTILRQVSF
jgi:hypothetical protein